MHPVRQPVHVVGDLGDRRLVVHPARRRRARSPAGRLGSPAGCATGRGGGKGREQAEGPADPRSSSSRASVLPPRPARRRRPAGGCCGCGQMNHINGRRTRRGFRRADVAASRRPTMRDRPRFRPFETALDPERALDDPARRDRRRRRRRALPRAAPLRGAGLRRRPAEDRELRRRRGLRPARRARRDRRLRPLHRDLRGGAQARRRDRPPRGRRRRRHPRRPAAADQPAALHRPRPVRRRRVRGQGRDAARDRRLPARPRPPRGAGLRHARRLDAGGRDPAPRRPAAWPTRGRWCGSTSRSSSRRTAGANRASRRRRPARPRAADGRPTTGRRSAREALRIALVNLDAEPAPAGRHGRGARPRLARHPAARGGRPRAGGRLQPQEDLGLRRADGHARRRARRDRGRRRHHPGPPRLASASTTRARPRGATC